MISFFRIILIVIFLLVLTPKAYAQSEYVLPYPSIMPGTIWYQMHQVKESLEEYWYFGEFGQITYNLKYADKYIVEAKILIEYKQYLLGHQALMKSDNYFSEISRYLIQAKNNGKNINEITALYQSASTKHIQLLNEIRENAPEEFLWTTEKGIATNLEIENSINRSIRIRGQII